MAVLELRAPRVLVGVPAANRARCPSAPNLHHSSHTHYQICPLSSHVKTKIPMAKMDFVEFLFCFTMSGQVRVCWVFFGGVINVRFLPGGTQHFCSFPPPHLASSLTAHPFLVYFGLKSSVYKITDAILTSMIILLSVQRLHCVEGS